jgi:hypothetical protein
MTEIRFTPKFENGKPAVRIPKADEWYLEDGLIKFADGYDGCNYPIFTRSEIEIPDHEPAGWVLRRTGEVRAATPGEFYVLNDNAVMMSTTYHGTIVEYPILSCEAFYD